MTPWQQQHLFMTDIRHGPGFIGWCEPGRGFQQSWFADEETALRLINQHRLTSNVWCSMGLFSSPGRRSSQRAETIKAFWLDVDAHGKQYHDPDECVTALKDFVQVTRLPRPNYLHMTGHGVQVFWVLPKPITRDAWQPVANALQDLGERHNLGADPITGDAARILRVPGTINHRDPTNPRDTVLHAIKAGHTDLEVFRRAITNALAELPPKPIQSLKIVSGPIPDTPENEELIRTMLAAIDPDADYPTWRDVVWAVAASGLPSAYDLARAWSEKGALWDEGAFEAVWSGFDPDREKGVGLGTLVHHARKAGYTGSIPSGEKFDKLEFKQDNRSKAPNAGSLVTQRAADIEPEPVEWLVEGAIPLGMMVVIGGQPGMGKSQIAIKLAAAVTTGEGFPDE